MTKQNVKEMDETAICSAMVVLALAHSGAVLVTGSLLPFVSFGLAMVMLRKFVKHNARTSKSRVY